MSVETIQMALGRLQAEPDDGEAWSQLQSAIQSSDESMSESEVERLLGQARARHEARREWDAVAQLLSFEISFNAGQPAEAPMQAELARIYQEELVDADRALEAYIRLLELKPEDPAAHEAVENDEAKRTKWRELVDRYLSEAEGATEGSFKSVLFASAADVAYRYGGDEEKDGTVQHLEKALELDPRNKRAAVLAERVYAEQERWGDVARVLEIALREGSGREDRVATGLRLGRVYAKRLSDDEKAITAYQQVLDMQPGQADAFSFLAESYSATEQWDHLVALYEDQLKGGGVKPSEELGILLQIAMVHWRMREQPEDAEPYFDRVRRAEPTHAGMLSYFRERCEASGDKGRLLTILTDAQRALPEGDAKRDLTSEIAHLAESQENAQKAIDQYKQVLRGDPDNREARDALKRLYQQTEGWNALVELHRQDLERTPADDAEARLTILRDIAAVYRDRVRSDQALVTVLTQIVHLDEKDVTAVRELTRVYESLSRWRDLLAYQQKLAELTEDAGEKADLYRAAARRWIEQFSNVQNAVGAYEGLLSVAPRDAEARSKLKELYLKRRAWQQLYALYERIQDDPDDDSDEIELLTEMAKLAAERLDKGAEAIRLLRRILELEPETQWVFDALEKQAEREKDFATLAEVLERRVDAAADDTARMALLQKLGMVYADRLKDSEATTRTWKRVLEVSPGNNRALRVLRETYMNAGDLDGLEELYSSQNDWEGLVDFLSSAADKTDDPDAKVRMSFRAARVYEQEIGAPERAMRSYERILGVAPEDSDAAAALVPIYENEEKWARLPGLYEVLLAATEDTEERVGMLRKLAAVTGGPLADKNAALNYARRAYEMSPDAEGLELLEAWSRAAGEWGPFVEAVEARLKKKKGLTKELRRTLKLKLAELYARELGKMDEAVASYKDLVAADPADAETITALDELLRSSERRDDLRWLFQLRSEQVEGEDRASVFEEWATLEEEVFGDSAEAASLFAKVVELVPTRGDALRSLARLLVAAEDYAGAADIIQKHRDNSEGEERGQREVELAKLYVDRLARPRDAFEAAVRALELVSHDEGAIGVLSKLLDDPDLRAEAAAVLEEEYAEAGDARREAEALRVMLESQEDPSERLALHVKLADVEEEKLSAPGTAFDVILRALNEAPEDLTIWDRAEDLANKAGRPTDLSEAYRAHLVGTAEQEVELPEAVELELCERAASLHDEKLGDPEGAMPYLDRLLAVDPSNERAFTRLKQILTGSERWGELEELYAKASDSTEDEPAKVELLNEVALICEEIIGDARKAIGYYERILEIDPQHTGAMDALEKLYESDERWQDLAKLLEQRLEISSDDETLEIKVYLGKIYLDKLHEPPKAMGHVEDVLRIREGDTEARDLCERLLEIGELRLRAAKVLEAVYEARDEMRSLVRVLDIRREGAEDEAERRELLHRIAEFRDERLHDDQGAFAALAELVPMEPEDAESRERFLETGTRLGEHQKVADVLTKAADACESPPIQGEILREVARICEDQLDDVDQAEKVYRRVIELDPSDPDLVVPAARALGNIYADREQHAELAEVLGLEVRLEDNVETRQELYERIGDLYEQVLSRPDDAIEAWRSRLSDDPGDDRALSALERLYEGAERWRDLCDVLRLREQASDEEEERRRTMVKAAEILSTKLDDDVEAINAWRAVLDEFGPDRATLAALGKLYEKAERWADLADTIDADLNLADEVDERLALWVRLGDLRRKHQEDLPGSLDAYRQALLLDPSSTKAREALESMLDLPDARREAAETLHPLYDADGNSEKLLKVLAIEVEESSDPTERLEKLDEALRTAEGALEDHGRAFEYAKQGVREAVGEAEAETWIQTLERLAESTGKWEETCQLYQDIVEDILDGDVQQDVRLRIGELARDKMDNRELSVEHYKKALDARADDRRALVALEGLYEKSSENADLLEILRVRVDNAEDDEEKSSLLFRMAKLQRGPLEDATGAIETYEAVLDIELAEEAITALEELYAAAERHTDRISLYERQLDAEPEAPADLRVKIAKICRVHSGDPLRSFDELGEALEIDPGHVEAVTELEQVLEESDDPEHRARAGEMLEQVYLRRADWQKVKRALGAILEASQDPNERSELLQRLATLHEEQLEDYTAALETVAQLLHEDLSDEGVWNELERLAKVAGAERRLAEIYSAELDEVPSDDEQTAKLCRRTGEIYADLNEVEQALSWYRRAYEFEPDSEELFEAIDGLLSKGDQHAERVELYRGALDYRDGDARIKALHTVAELQREKLKEPEAAIETYVSALDIDEADETSLDALTELYWQLGKHRELADHYLRRAEMAPDGEQAAPFRLQLAKVLRQSLDDTTGAIDQLQTIVEEVPWNDGAIKELESLTDDEEHKARVVDILRPLYERSDDWRLLVKLNEDRFNLAEDVLDKVQILTETAQLWETRGGDQARGFGALRVAFDLEPENTDTRSELERLAEDLEAWDELADSYQAGVEKSEEDYVKRDLLLALAKVQDERLDDPRRALVAYGALSQLDPTDITPLEAMDTLATLLGDWKGVIDVLEKKSELVSDAENAAAWRRIAETKFDMLDDADGAMTAYERALELDPSDAATIDALTDLYEPEEDAEAAMTHDRAQRLVELYTQRVDIAGEDESDLRYDLNVRAAKRYEEALENRQEAISVLGAALDARPGDAAVLSMLERLYRAEEMWDDLLENLKLQAGAAEETDDRVKLRIAIGDLYKTQLDEANEALEQYRMVLAEAPTNDHAITEVKAIGDAREELRLDVADVLEPVLREAERHEDLVAVLELRLTGQTDPSDRTQTLRSIALTLDEQLERPEDAEAALLRAMEDSPDDDELHDEIERLAGRCEGHERYADALSQRAGATFDAVIAKNLFVRLGRISEENLKDDRRAVDAYAKAVEHAGDELELLEALDRLYERLEDNEALAEVIERRVEQVDEDGKADLMHRLAVLQIEAFENPTEGLATLRVALERSPNHEKAREALEKLTDDKDLFEEAAEVLENVYRQSGDNSALARLYDKRIQYAPSAGERVRMRLDLSRVLEERSGDTKAALEVLQKALDDEPGDSDVLSEIERLAGATDGWKSAADALETAVKAHEELTPEVASDLWMRSAGWRKDHAEDLDGAEKAFEAALGHDPQNDAILRSIEELQRAPGREKDLIGTLRRLAELDGGASSANELRKEAKELAQSALEDDELAEAILREMIEADDGDRWAMSELATLREKAEDFQEVFDLLVRQAELSADAEVLKELRHSAAEVASEKLKDKKAAIDLYEQLFEDAPRDEKASGALRALYAEGEMNSELLALLGRLVDLADEVEQRAQLRLEAAALCDKLNADTEAIEHLRAILDEDESHQEATLQMSRLLEKTGRDEELAELLSKQIQLATDRDDVESELRYRVRLGEVQESQLGSTEKAIATFAGVLERDPDHKEALLSLARLHGEAGDKAESAKMLERVLDKAEGDEAIETALRLADLFGEIEDAEGVRRALEQGLKADEAHQDLRDRLRTLYEKEGAWAEFAEMITWDADHAEEDKEKISLLRKAADVHQHKREDPAMAADLLVRATELAPEDRDLLLLLCDAYSASGRGKQSVEVLEKIVESYGGRRSKDLAVIHHRLAKAHLADGDKPKGLEELDIAFKIDPGSVAVLRELGILALELADESSDDEEKKAYIDRAQKTFRALLLQRLDETSPITKAEVFFYLGQTSHKQGDDKKAIQMLERALDNDKELEKARTLLDELKS